MIVIQGMKAWNRHRSSQKAVRKQVPEIYTGNLHKFLLSAYNFGNLRVQLMSSDAD